VKCSQLTDFVDSQITKISTHAISIEKVTASHKKLKSRMKEGQTGLRENFDKFHIEVESKIEVMRTKTHNEFSGIKNAMNDLLNYDKI
jgi:hypothetical protein